VETPVRHISDTLPSVPGAFHHADASLFQLAENRAGHNARVDIFLQNPYDTAKALLPLELADCE
jgi:hypothetical protein